MASSHAARWGRLVISSSFLPASQSLHCATRASGSGAICRAGTPMVSSRLARASPGLTGRCPRTCPFRGRKICPSGTGRPADARRGPRMRSCRPGHPADRMNGYHPAMGTGARRYANQLLPLLLTASERGDVAGQCPGRCGWNSSWVSWAWTRSVRRKTGKRNRWLGHGVSPRPQTATHAEPTPDRSRSLLWFRGLFRGLFRVVPAWPPH